MLTSQNAEGVHGQRKVGNPWSMQIMPIPQKQSHFILQCPKYTYQRSKLKHATDKLHIDFNLQNLLRSEAAAAHVLAFVHGTHKTI